ncbi:hypothetical protein HZY88_09040 [Aerococcaceae bacterium DSM 111176]|nr:hypothetical protein [Aerococcaceae bacterium DSM 111176]
MSNKIQQNNKYKTEKVEVPLKELVRFENYMVNLFPELKSGRQRPRNPNEKEKLTEWAKGDPIELNKI